MQLKRLNVCICSESDDVNSLISVLYGLKNQNFNLNITKYGETSIEQNDIIIHYLDKFSTSFLESLGSVRTSPQIRSVVILEGNDIQLVSTLAKMGINDLFVFPYELYKFHLFIEELLQTLQPKIEKIEEFKARNNPIANFIGNFSGIDNIISLAKKAAENPALNVLLLGETGTGKSVLAKLIHSLGEKKSAPFIEVICTAIPENLLESELFGYEKGAFTDAKNRKMGLFELAEGGTIFLDEIGDLSLNLQAKLLHVTENKVIRRLGGVKDIPVNTRIITATNRNLEKQIAKNLFRSDLYYRLNMITLTLPTLTQRNGDLIALTEHFIKEFSQLYGKTIECISNQAWDIIRTYNWPGNVRELRHIVERAVLLSDGPVLNEKYFISIKKERLASLKNTDLSPEIEEFCGQQQNSCQTFSVSDSKKIILELNYNDITLMELNKIYARKILEKLSGNKSKTSKLLGISRPTLDNLLN